MSGGARPDPGSGADPVERLVGQYNELREELVGTARQVTRERDVAEDVVQDVFARLLERVQAGAAIELSAGYLTAAVRRAALYWHRNRQKRQDPTWRSAVAIGSMSVPTPSDVLRDTSMEVLIAEIRRELTPSQEAVFELVDLQGLSYAAASQEAGHDRGERQESALPCTASVPDHCGVARIAVDEPHLIGLLCRFYRLGQ